MANLIRIHGRGRLATLYEAETQVGKRVAVKQLREHVRENPRLRDRLFQSARQWAALPHPYLLDCIDVDSDRGWIISDWMPTSISAVTPVLPVDALRILTQSLEALQYLNEAGYFHANIKPSNVRLSSRGDVRLADGLLLAIDSPGVIPSIGTPKYLAPEVTAAAAKAPGPGIDLYALGLTLLESMVGQGFVELFPGVGRQAGDGDMSWLQWHANPAAILAPTSQLVQNCPPELALVIDRMLVKDPYLRYRFAEQVLADLPQSVAALTQSQDVKLEVSRQLHSGPEFEHVATIPSVSNTRRDSQPTPRHSAKDILPRPLGGIAIGVVSGSRAGATYGFEATELTVGVGCSCDVLLEDAYAGEPMRVRIQRQSSGWEVTPEAGVEYLAINQTIHRTTAKLRSGDVVRLSLEGPDFQFYLQSGTPTISEIAAKHLPTTTVNRTSGRRNANETMRNQTKLPPQAKPLPNSSPKKVLHNQPADGTRPMIAANSTIRRPVPILDSGTISPFAPLPPDVTTTTSPLHKSANETKSTTRTNAEAFDDVTEDPAPAPKWLAPRSWDKSTRDKAMIALAVAAALLAVVFIPAGNGAAKTSNANELTGQPSVSAASIDSKSVVVRVSGESN